MPAKASNLRVGVMSEWLGVAGSISCYLAMFPLAVVGMAGLAGISVAKILPWLNAYMVSPFFNSVLILSVVLLVIGMIPGGWAAIVLSVVAGVAIFVSMNVYMQAWIFLLAFIVLAAAGLVASYHSVGALRARDVVRSVLPLVIIVVILGLSTYLSEIPPQPARIQPPGSSQLQEHVLPLRKTPTVMPMQMP